LAPSVEFYSYQITFNTEEDMEVAITTDDLYFSHIAYGRNDTDGDWEIWYANNLGGWGHTRVTSNTVMDTSPSIAVDGTGKAHIAYESGTGSAREIWYATNASGTWVLDQVTDNFVVDTSAVIAVDSDGRVHIAYDQGEFGSGVIHHAVSAGGGWTHEQVSSGTGSSEQPSIAVDAHGRVHVAYRQFVGSTDYEIVYAVREGSAWTRSQVTDNAVTDWYPSLTVSGAGVPHIAYSRDMSDFEIYYATRPGTTWTTTRITDDANQNHNPSIALDGDCEAYVAYQGGGVHFASSADGWASSAVTTTSGASLTEVDRAIGIAGDGGVNVMYWSSDGNDLEIYYAVPETLVGTGRGTCCLPLLIGCGHTVVGETTGRGSAIDRYSCMPPEWPLEESGPEVLYALRLAGGLHDVTATLSDLGGVDLDVFILSSAGCDAGTCLQDESYGDNSATASYVMPGTYFIAVDGYDGVEGTYTLTVSCTEVGEHIYLPLALRSYP
jgi:hypothetical protein